MTSAVLAETNRSQLRGLVAELRQTLPLLRERYHVASLAVFGSYVRGEETDQSDLDLLVTFSITPSFFKLVELENFLTDRLRVKVDIVMKDSLRPSIGQRVLREMLPV